MPFWWILGQLRSNDEEAFSELNSLLREYCELEERVVAVAQVNPESQVEGSLLQCEMRQLYPEREVYCICSCRTHEKRSQAYRINLGCFDSRDDAVNAAFEEMGCPVAKWICCNVS
jgi:hypothetical protein